MNYLKLIFSTALITALLPFSAHANTDDNWNITTNPLGLILGVNANLQYKIADNMTIGPDLSFVSFNIDSVKASGLGIGITGDYYFDQAFKTGWYASAGLGYETIAVDYTDIDNNKFSARVNNFTVKGLGGYKWFWGRSFNLTLGLGLAANFPSKRDITSDDGSETKSVPLSAISLAGDASIGWTF
jgi:hypothetical protein